MVWRARGPGPEFRVVGTAHFFPRSFGPSLRVLIRRAEIVAFEGPLDAESLDGIAVRGRDGSAPGIADLVDEDAATELSRLLRERVLRRPGIRTWFSLPPPGRECLALFTRGMRPWMALRGRRARRRPTSGSGSTRA
jgi:hypothetical protein